MDWNCAFEYEFDSIRCNNPAVALIHIIEYHPPTHDYVQEKYGTCRFHFDEMSNPYMPFVEVVRIESLEDQ